MASACISRTHRRRMGWMGSRCRSLISRLDAWEEEGMRFLRPKSDQGSDLLLSMESVLAFVNECDIEHWEELSPTRPSIYNAVSTIHPAQASKTLATKRMRPQREELVALRAQSVELERQILSMKKAQEPKTPDERASWRLIALQEAELLTLAQRENCRLTAQAQTNRKLMDHLIAQLALHTPASKAHEVRAGALNERVFVQGFTTRSLSSG